MWRPKLAPGHGPRYLALADAIASDVASGRLKPGARLPPQRDLSQWLGLAVSTVTRGYGEAIGRGLLVGEVGRGTFVATGSPRGAAPLPSLEQLSSGPIDFSRNLPVPGQANLELARTLEALADEVVGLGLLQHGQEPSEQRRMQVAARWIARLGLPAEGREVLATTGAQHGLLVSMLALLRPGQVMLVEALTYAPVRALAQQLGIRLVAVPMDGDGLVPEALAAACRAHRARALYCMPTLQTPTAITMSARRRQHIAAIADECKLSIIEDDVFGFLPESRPLPLACCAPNRTVYVTSTSKSLAPGLRVGWVHAPAALGPALRAAIARTCWMPPPLMVELATRWMADGTADRLNAEQRRQAVARNALAREVLGQRVAARSALGLHVWVGLPRRWTSDAFWVAAKRAGVEIQPASAFSVHAGDAPRAIRLCLSHEADPGRVLEGLQILETLLEQGPEVTIDAA